MAKATQEAITLQAVVPLTKRVNSFVAELPTAQQTMVRDAVKTLVESQRSIVNSRLTIGKTLAELHHALGQESFSKFCLEVGQHIGIKRTTAFRYLAGFKMVHGEFGQAAPEVLALTDGGNSIVRTEPKTGKISLTPEAKLVLEKMPALKDKASNEERDQWSRAYVTLVGKAGRSASKQSTPLEMVEARLDKVTSAFDDIAERVNKLAGAKERRAALDAIRDTIEYMTTEHAKLAKTVNAVEVEEKAAATKATKAKASAPVAAVA